MLSPVYMDMRLLHALTDALSDENETNRLYRKCLDGLRCVMVWDQMPGCDVLRLKMFHSQCIGWHNRKGNSKIVTS